MKFKVQSSKLSLSNIYYITLFYILILILGFLAIGSLLYTSQVDLVKSQEERYHSYLLADELRQSSDDLTRFARTYAITGEERYEEYFLKILDIRNGDWPRPKNYNRIYWDLVTAGVEEPSPDTESISLTELMKLAGVTDEEFEKLEEAHLNSDELAIIEVYAMDAMKGIISDEAKELMLPSESPKEFASRIMFDQNYHNFKGNIMSPINDFLIMLDERTKTNVEMYAKRQRDLFLVIGLFLIMMIASIIVIFTVANHKLRSNEQRLEKRAMALQNSLEQLQITQSKLVESEKMASLGSLVAGVTHEINTPIGLGITLATYLESEMENFRTLYETEKLSKLEFEKYLAIIEESSHSLVTNMNRASKLIKSFKQVAVDQSADKIRTFDLKDYFEEILDSLKAELKHTQHKIYVECSEGIELTTYPGALYQIIVNLIMNSMMHGFERIDDGIISIKAKENGDSITLNYKDNGHGISEENMKKIYDPFFTTKFGEGGSGLGLNIVFNLVNETLNGTIECTSVLDEGTQFHIEFPKYQSESINPSSK